MTDDTQEGSDTMKSHIRIVTAAIVLVAVLGGAPAVASANAHHTAMPSWERALTLRSQALDRRYRLGSFRPIGRGLHLTATQRHSGWLRALRLRSVGMDQLHHLGTFVRPPVM